MIPVLLVAAPRAFCEPIGVRVVDHLAYPLARRSKPDGDSCPAVLTRVVPCRWGEDGHISGRVPAIDRTSASRDGMSIDGVSGERWSAADAGAVRSGASVSVRVSVSGTWTIVAIVGEMDLLVVPLVSELVDADARHLVFELRQVTFMDGRGLDLLLRSQRDALKAGGCVRLVAPSRKVRRLLMLTGSNREFTTFESVDEATSVPAPAPPR